MAKELRGQGYKVTLDEFVVGALGTWGKENAGGRQELEDSLSLCECVLCQTQFAGHVTST